MKVKHAAAIVGCAAVLSGGVYFAQDSLTGEPVAPPSIEAPTTEGNGNETQGNTAPAPSGDGAAALHS